MKSNNRIIHTDEADNCKKLAVKLSKKLLPKGFSTTYRDRNQSVEFRKDIGGHTLELAVLNRDTCQSFESGRTVTLSMYGTRTYCGGHTNFTKKTIKEFEEQFTKACEILSNEYKEQLKEYKLEKKREAEFKKVVKLLKIQKKTKKNQWGEKKSIKVIGDTEVSVWNKSNGAEEPVIQIELTGVTKEKALEIAKVLRK